MVLTASPFVFRHARSVHKDLGIAAEAGKLHCQRYLEIDQQVLGLRRLSGRLVLNVNSKVAIVPGEMAEDLPAYVAVV